jgi:hypothetical protein
MNGFGKLERIDLRELWPNEAHSFTPWLCLNLPSLGEVLGMDLEFVQQESPVGPFSLDIVARDLGSDRIVIIENQIEPTDHDHLGKLLTYAAGHEASVAVWIASSFREEHRQALDWLNNRTDNETEFFGVVLEALKIDDSRPAPNFKLVAFPNDFRKRNVGRGTGKASPRSEAYAAFFQELIDRLRTQHQFTQARKGQPQSWYTFTSGLKGVSYAVSFSMGGRVRTEIYIDRPNQAWNKWFFDLLLADRSQIENELGVTAEWERLDEKRASRIAIYRQGAITDDEQVLESIRGWAIEQLLPLKAVVGPKAAALVAQGGPEQAETGSPSDEMFSS